MQAYPSTIHSPSPLHTIQEGKSKNQNIIFTPSKLLLSKSNKISTNIGQLNSATTPLSCCPKQGNYNSHSLANIGNQRKERSQHKADQLQPPCYPIFLFKDPFSQQLEGNSLVQLRI